METENKVVKYLIENKRELTIRQLSKEIKSDYKIVHTAVNRLVAKGILNAEKIGNSTQVKICSKLSKEVLVVEFERREEISKNKNIKLLLETIKEKTAIINFVLLLFGSYAKGNQNKNSDIDLMFIVPELKIEKKIEEAVSILPLKIHFLVFTEKQFIDMENSKELNVVKEAIKSNVILHGIEQYYELINK